MINSKLLRANTLESVLFKFEKENVFVAFTDLPKMKEKKKLSGNGGLGPQSPSTHSLLASMVPCRPCSWDSGPDILHQPHHLPGPTLGNESKTHSLAPMGFQS
jgi:hypothetical protein